MKVTIQKGTRILEKIIPCLPNIEDINNPASMKLFTLSLNDKSAKKLIKKWFRKGFKDLLISYETDDFIYKGEGGIIDYNKIPLLHTMFEVNFFFNDRIIVTEKKTEQSKPKSKPLEFSKENFNIMEGKLALIQMFSDPKVDLISMNWKPTYGPPRPIPNLTVKDWDVFEPSRTGEETFTITIKR